jgi:hypothetical protein
MLAQKKEMTPKTGFNLVGLDDFEDPGEQLFLISSHKTEPEAKAAQKKYMSRNKDVKTFIYGSAGKSESVVEEMNSLLAELENGLQVNLATTLDKNLTQPVKSVQDASKVVRQYLSKHGLGASAMEKHFGDVTRKGTLVAKISYNGRMWDPDGKELK